LVAKIRSTEAMARKATSAARARWTVREKRKGATASHTKKWKKTWGAGGRAGGWAVVQAGGLCVRVWPV
jgi:hypothetical protein